MGWPDFKEVYDLARAYKNLGLSRESVKYGGDPLAVELAEREVKEEKFNLLLTFYPIWSKYCRICLKLNHRNSLRAAVGFEINDLCNKAIDAGEKQWHFLQDTDNEFLYKETSDAESKASFATKVLVEKISGLEKFNHVNFKFAERATGK